MKRMLPLVLINVLVISAIAMLIVTMPAYARFAALAMPVLLVVNFFFIRNVQRKRVEAIASGAEAPPSAAKMRNAMWVLAGYGALSYLSGASNLPMLLGQHEPWPWLGWLVKMTIGTFCIWAALRIHKSKQSANHDSARPE
jgi:hypothetical protein